MTTKRTLIAVAGGLAICGAVWWLFSSTTAASSALGVSFSYPRRWYRVREYIQPSTTTDASDSDVLRAITLGWGDHKKLDIAIASTQSPWESFMAGDSGLPSRDITIAGFSGQVVHFPLATAVLVHAASCLYIITFPTDATRASFWPAPQPYRSILESLTLTPPSLCSMP